MPDGKTRPDPIRHNVDLATLQALQRAGVTYRVLRNHKLPPDSELYSEFYDETTVVAEGLSWEDAKALSDRLQGEEALANPRQTSWTIDLFFPEREDGGKSAVGLKRRRARRRSRKAATAPKADALPQPLQLTIEWPQANHMRKTTIPCPRCRGIAPEHCTVCNGRGHWPGDTEFDYLHPVTVVLGDGTPDGQSDHLIGQQGVVVGLVNRDELTCYNFLVVVEGEGAEPHTLTPGMLAERASETFPRCPACDSPLKTAAGQMSRHLDAPVWRCEAEDCDASDVAVEFAFAFDFTVFERATPGGSVHFPSQTVRQVWAFALKFDCDLAQQDAESPVDPDEAARDPKYLEAALILSEHDLLAAGAATQPAA